MLLAFLQWDRTQILENPKAGTPAGCRQWHTRGPTSNKERGENLPTAGFVCWLACKFCGCICNHTYTTMHSSAIEREATSSDVIALLKGIWETNRVLIVCFDFYLWAQVNMQDVWKARGEEVQGKNTKEKYPSLQNTAMVLSILARAKLNRQQKKCFITLENICGVIIIISLYWVYYPPN